MSVHTSGEGSREIGNGLQFLAKKAARRITNNAKSKKIFKKKSNLITITQHDIMLSIFCVLF